MSHDSTDGSIGSEAGMADDPVVKYIIKYTSPGHSIIVKGMRLASGETAKYRDQTGDSP